MDEEWDVNVGAQGLRHVRDGETFEYSHCNTNATRAQALRPYESHLVRIRSTPKSLRPLRLIYRFARWAASIASVAQCVMASSSSKTSSGAVFIHFEIQFVIRDKREHQILAVNAPAAEHGARPHRPDAAHLLQRHLHEWCRGFRHFCTARAPRV